MVWSRCFFVGQFAQYLAIIPGRLKIDFLWVRRSQSLTKTNLSSSGMSTLILMFSPSSPSEATAASPTSNLLPEPSSKLKKHEWDQNRLQNCEFVESKFVEFWETLTLKYQLLKKTVNNLSFLIIDYCTMCKIAHFARQMGGQNFHLRDYITWIILHFQY